MPGISVRACTTPPPPASICFSESSIASTSIVMTGAGIEPPRCVMPPLIEPGSVGRWVFSSTGPVIAIV